MQVHEEAAKRFGYMTLGGICLVSLVIVSFLVWLCNRPISPDLALDALSGAVDGAYLAWVDDVCYEFTQSGSLSELCSFSGWKPVKNKRVKGISCL